MKYTLQFKTGDAELRALKAIPSDYFRNPNFRLLIEITRGRKSKKDEIGDLQKRINALNSFLDFNSTIFFDITSDSNLSNNQIDELFLINDGYKNWQVLFDNLKEHYINAIPMLIYNDLDTEYENFKQQIKSLSSKHKKIGYKIYPTIDIKTILAELSIIATTITKDTEVFIFYDQGYIIEGLSKLAEEKAVSYFGNVTAIFDNHSFVECILISTSFPDSVTSLSGKENGVIPLTEISLFNSVKQNVGEIKISYSDYGSITPKRNDDVAYYGKGWTPRIDVPVIDSNLIFYYRCKKGDNEYADTYNIVAKSCIKDAKFPNELDCWGCYTIKNTAMNMKPGATPSFWISVRMNIFVTQQLKRLSII